MDENRRRYPATLVSPEDTRAPSTDRDPRNLENQRTIANAKITNPDMLAHATSVPPPAVVNDPYTGRTIDGRYLVEGILGEGGMGVVYRGRHKVIDKRVAIKILRGEMARDLEMVQRFLNEARAASSIGNAHIVDIADFGQLPDGATYFVMEYLDGQSLADRMVERGPMAPLEIVHIARQIAEGLEAAHKAGIVHRDLKPDNVMLVSRGADRDFAKILDFGIAKVGGEGKKLTRAGSVFGTPHYMSPEQAAGATVDARTDIYSLGVIMYEMAAGRVPFDAENFMGILSQHMYKAPDSVRSIRGDLPPSLDAIILKCMSKKVENRFNSMLDLVRDLDLFAHGQVPESVPELMSRSANADSPPDYLWNERSGLHSAVRSAVPADRPRMGILVGLGGAIVIMALVASVLIYARYSASHVAALADNQVPTSTTPVADVASATHPSPDTSSTGTAGAGAATVDLATPGFRNVMLVAVPNDAHGKRGDIDIGIAPFPLSIKPGETVQVTLTRDGYVPQTVTVDGSKGDRQVVQMQHVPQLGTKSTAAAPSAKLAPAIKPETKKCKPGQNMVMGDCID